MSLHSDTLPWFQDNQFLFLLLNAAFLAEKQQTPILYSLDWPHWCSNPWSPALESSMLTITQPMRFWVNQYSLYLRNVECLAEKQ